MRVALALGLVLSLTAPACADADREPRPPASRPAEARLASEPFEGFGATTKGGAGGRVIRIREATEAAVRRAFQDAAREGRAIIRFEVDAPIAIGHALPHLTAPHVTIEGGGATLDGSAIGNGPALVDVRTHDVIVRDLRLRNGYDNLRVQGPDAFDIVITHVSSTGSQDDGISIGYGAHDVTVQYALLAGNTRSVFIKEGGTTNVSLHHSWIQKGWARSPLVSGPARTDLRNLIVEDWGEWGTRFEDGASGNVIASLFVLSPYAHRHGAKPDAALRVVKAGPVFTADNAFRGAAVAAAGDAAEALPAPAVHTASVAEMERLVRERAGCLPRDEIDRHYIALADGWTVAEAAPLRPASGRTGGGSMMLSIQSPSFTDGEEIPTTFTCEGKNVSPALSWSGIPTGTKSLALVVDDPDAPDPKAPKMTWVHWVLYDIPPAAAGLPEAVTAAVLPPGTREGLNDWKRTGYGGPCPPIGRHRYFHRLYALDTVLPDLREPTKAALERAMAGHVLAQATLVGTYEKKRK